MIGRAWGVLALTGALLTGCLSDGSCAGVLGPSPAAASCASAVEYDGRVYLAWSGRLPVAKGELLGDAVYPTCNDTGCVSDAEPQPARVWALRGADPGQVVVGRLEGMDEWVVYARPGADVRDFFRRDGRRWELRQPSR
jgi:hypothetical protein